MDRWTRASCAVTAVIAAVILGLASANYVFAEDPPPATVIVRLVDDRPAGAVGPFSAPTVQALQAGFRANATVPVEIVYELEALPALVVNATPEEIEALRDDPRVASVEELPRFRLFDTPTIAENDPEAASLVRYSYLADAALPFTGAGMTVAVVDTGIRHDHEQFADITVREKCLVSSTNVCPEGIGEGPGYAADTEGHGTHVAGIVSSVAPTADLLIYRVHETHQLFLDGLALIRSVDDLAKNELDVDVINFSWGGGAFAEACPGGAYGELLQIIRDRGTLIAVSTGNAEYVTEIGSPACDPNVISVGSVNDGTFGDDLLGNVSYFTNSADIMTVLAPGYWISAANYQSTSTLVALAGTSMASPFVAGALALFLESGATPEEAEAMLLRGPLVTDHRAGAGNRQTPRLDIRSAFQLPDATDSTVSAPPEEVIADGTTASTVTVTLVDSVALPLTPLRDSQFTITFTDADGDPVEGASRTDIEADEGTPGTYTFDVTSTVAAEVTVTVAVHDVELDDTPILTFVVGPPDAGETQVTASPTTVVADGVTASTVTVTLVDAGGASIVDVASGDFGVELAPDTTATVSPVTEGDPGVYTFTVTNSVPEDVTVTVTADRVTLDDVPTITFIAPIDPDSPVTASPTSLQRGNASTVTIELLDELGDPYPGLASGPFVISLTGAAQHGAVTEGDPGIYTFTVTNAVAQTVTATVTVAGLQLAAQPTIQFTPPPSAPPSPSPSPTSTPVTEPGGVAVGTEERQSAPINPGASTSVQAAGSDGSAARVTVPAGALPAGGEVSVASIADLDDLIAQAPPTGLQGILVAYQVLASDSAGTAITGAFNAPVELAFTVPASALPPDVPPSELTVVFWNGSGWVEVPAILVIEADGSITLVATVDHFTIFSIGRRIGMRTFSVTPTGPGIALALWGGGSLAEATASLGPTLQSLWVTRNDRFTGYFVGAPAFANANFLAYFPGGYIPADTPMLIVTR